MSTLKTINVQHPTAASANIVLDNLGNVSIPTSGARITGDFSNATVANQLSFQTSSTNSATIFPVIPNGTGTSASIRAYSNSDPTNSPFIGIVSNSTSETRVVSGALGTGSFIPMTLYTGGSERLRIDTSGNVGIGTSSPTQKLVINDASTAAEWDGLRVISAANPSGTSYTYINIEKGSGYGGAIAGYLQQGVGSGLAFFSNNAGTRTERMRIDSNGSIGVGTTSPAVRFHVASNNNGIAATAAAGASANIYLGGNGNTLGAGSFDLLQGSSSEAYVYQRAAQPLIFGTSNTERARIDASGNLLVGVSANAGNSPRLFVRGLDSLSTTWCFLTQNGAGNVGLLVRNDNNVYMPQVYNNTTGVGTNMVVGSDGALYRSTSSRKYKRDIVDATHGLNELLALRPVTYKGKAEADGETKYGGLIAEEVHDAGLTEFVQYAEDGTPDALAYGNMVSLCIKAIQELKAELDAVKAELATVKGA